MRLFLGDCFDEDYAYLVETITLNDNIFRVGVLNHFSNTYLDYQLVVRQFPTQWFIEQFGNCDFQFQDRSVLYCGNKRIIFLAFGMAMTAIRCRCQNDALFVKMVLN